MTSFWIAGYFGQAVLRFQLLAFGLSERLRDAPLDKDVGAGRERLGGKGYASQAFLKRVCEVAGEPPVFRIALTSTQGLE